MRVDLAIVGAGIMGATIASQARRLIPGLSIAVIEAGNAEQSATRLSAGLVTPFCGEGTRRRRSEFAYRYYEEQASQHDDVRKVPFTFSHEQGRPQPPLLFETRLPQGTLASIVRRRRGELATGSVFQAGHAFVIDVPRLAARYLTPGCSAVVRLNERVKSVRYADQQWVLSTGHDRLLAKHVIFAMGAQTKSLLGGVQDSLIKKIVAFDLHGPTRPGPEEGVIYLPSRQSFLMPNRDQDGWLLSITSHDWRTSTDEAVCVHEHERQEAKNILHEEFPGLAVHSMVPRVALDSYRTDGEPRVACLPQGPNGCAVYGACGSGVRFAPALANEALVAVGLLADIPEPPFHFSPQQGT